MDSLASHTEDIRFCYEYLVENTVHDSSSPFFILLVLTY